MRFETNCSHHIHSLLATGLPCLLRIFNSEPMFLALPSRFFAVNCRAQEVPTILLSILVDIFWKTFSKPIIDRSYTGASMNITIRTFPFPPADDAEIGLHFTQLNSTMDFENKTVQASSGSRSSQRHFVSNQVFSTTVASFHVFQEVISRTHDLLWWAPHPCIFSIQLHTTQN